MGIFDYIKESLSIAIKEFINEIEKEFSRTIFNRLNERLISLKRQIIKETIGIFIILISFGFLTISGVFFLIEYLNLSKTLSFLIMGIFVLIIGLVI